MTAGGGDRALQRECPCPCPAPHYLGALCSKVQTSRNSGAVVSGTAKGRNPDVKSGSVNTSEGASGIPGGCFSEALGWKKTGEGCTGQRLFLGGWDDFPLATPGTAANVLMAGYFRIQEGRHHEALRSQSPKIRCSGYRASCARKLSQLPSP